MWRIRMKLARLLLWLAEKLAAAARRLEGGG
jgi:hypothetical protein